MKSSTPFVLDVNPRIPPSLSRLEELANNLWYSWNRPARALFAQLNPKLWNSVGHSPKVMLRRVDEERLLTAADDAVFLNNYRQVLAAYDTYHADVEWRNGPDGLRGTDLIAYFCAEFGFHESLPIYSGGLGILAGDYCKAASDLRLPFVGVGLLYRQGYFSQAVDGEGGQQATYSDSDFDDLPIRPVHKDDGSELHVSVEMPGRSVDLKVWQARVGRVGLYLLDSDVASNDEHDRDITHRLYGGDRTTRVEQEIILGIGGTRVIAALGLAPTIWHANEGHAAFLVLERARGFVARGLDFASALEAVAVNTVFTTHTAVPAGHDHFSEDMIRAYFADYCRETGISPDALMALGRTSASPEFNMTALAVRGSRHQNGVSKIHGDLSSRMLSEFWPQVEPAENPITYVTNGVHVDTFLSDDWTSAFERFMGADWTQHLGDRSWWSHTDQLPDQSFWSVRQYLKARMLHLVRYRVREQHLRNQGSEAHLDRLLKHANPDDPNVLTIGFGRRFATYKRAALLFENLDRLRSILSDKERPVLFIFTGKAHPADGPGQDIIRKITQISKMPEFEGKVLFVEGYDLRLARRLVSGVDVWLNNPIYPLEASGTSGMKAGMNGVINLSVLDGWWGEGYEAGNGWGIKPAKVMDEGRRNREDANALYELLEDQVIPLYYARGNTGFSTQWISIAKRSMATILPKFNASRMVGEYVSKFYVPASRQGRRFAADNSRPASQLAAWKAHVRDGWPGVSIRRIDEPKRRIQFGERMVVEVAVKLDTLKPSDVVVELVLDRGHHRPESTSRILFLPFVADGITTDAGEARFVLSLEPEVCGQLNYRIRCFPYHALLTHRFELGMTIWV